MPILIFALGLLSGIVLTIIIGIVVAIKYNKEK
jgi:hypothetical protein